MHSHENKETVSEEYFRTNHHGPEKGQDRNKPELPTSLNNAPQSVPWQQRQRLTLNDHCQHVNTPYRHTASSQRMQRASQTPRAATRGYCLDFRSGFRFQAFVRTYVHARANRFYSLPAHNYLCIVICADTCVCMYLPIFLSLCIYVCLIIQSIQRIMIRIHNVVERRGHGARAYCFCIRVYVASGRKSVNLWENPTI